MSEFCDSSDYNLKNITTFLSTAYKVKANYTLLITFNAKIFVNNIPLLFHFYRDFFQQIIFCGFKIIDVLNETRGLSPHEFDKYTFSEFNSFNGYFHYYCVNKVIEMSYQTEGILLASDDVLLKYWNFVNLDSSKIWFPRHLEPNLELKENIENFNWVWWTSNTPLLIKLFDFILDGLSNRANLSNKEIDLTKKFITILDNHRINNLYILFASQSFRIVSFRRRFIQKFRHLFTNCFTNYFTLNQ